MHSLASLGSPMVSVLVGLLFPFLAIGASEHVER